MKPILDRIVVKRTESQTVSDGGIALVDPEKLSEGTILSVGPGMYSKRGVMIPTTLKAGEVVMFDSHVGVPIKIDGTELLVMREQDVLGVVE